MAGRKKGSEGWFVCPLSTCTCVIAVGYKLSNKPFVSRRRLQLRSAPYRSFTRSLGRWLLASGFRLSFSVFLLLAFFYPTVARDLYTQPVRSLCQNQPSPIRKKIVLKYHFSTLHTGI